MDIQSNNLYVCPNCQAALQPTPSALFCSGCAQNYPVARGMPDFVLTKPADNPNPFLHGFGKFLAPIYEGPFWFSIMLRLLGGKKAPSLSDIVELVSQRMAPIEGRILDFATGTGTYGRHVATENRDVFGIDISREMLKKGQQYVENAHIANMHFARADGTALPFPDQVFDGCLLCGSLHIFPDTVGVLREIGRTLKPQATVVATTVIHGEEGILKIKNGRKPALKNMKAFDLPELENLIKEAGYTEFKAEPFGCLVLFSMRKV